MEYGIGRNHPRKSQLSYFRGEGNTDWASLNIHYIHSNKIEASEERIFECNAKQDGRE